MLDQIGHPWCCFWAELIKIPVRSYAKWSTGHRKYFSAETRKLMHTNGTEIPDFKRFSISLIQFRARRAKVTVGESTIDPVVSFDCNTRFQQQSKLTNVSWCHTNEFLTVVWWLGALEWFQLGLLPCDPRRGWRIHFRDPCSGQIWGGNGFRSSIKQDTVSQPPIPINSG